jgi:hypothetical protein
MTFPNRGIVAPVYAAAACRFIGGEDLEPRRKSSAG